MLLLVLVLKQLLVDSSCYKPLFHQLVNSVCAIVLLLTSMAASGQCVFSHAIACKVDCMHSDAGELGHCKSHPSHV